MTGEELERAIDFLLKSQATLEARIEQVNTNLGARIAQTNEQIAETSKRLDQYANMQTTLVQVMTRTYKAQAAINKRTDEKLNALVNTVEKLIQERSGGKP
jgi:DNA-binding transcriptional regulator GbsR (MarR family)